MEIEYTDLQLIEKSIEGENKYFGILFDRYRDSIYKMLLSKYPHSDECRDIVQDTFIKAYINIDKFKPEYTFGQWVFTIARNLLIDHTRRAKTKPQPSELTNKETEDTTPNPEMQLIKLQSSKQLYSIFSLLAPNYKTIIEMRYYNELSYEEIATKLNLPVGTVKTRIHRAREKLYTLITSNLTSNDFLEDN